MIAAIILYVMSVFTIIMIYMVATPTVFSTLDAIASAYVGTHTGWINWFIGTALKTGYTLVFVIMLAIVTWQIFMKSQETEVVYSQKML